MRVYFVALIAVLSLSPFVSSQSNIRSRQKTQEGQTKKNHKSDSTNPTIVVQCGTECRPSNSLPNTNDIQLRPHDWVDKLNAGATTVIAAFTILLFGGIFYQVQNLRDVERAWLVVDTWTTPKELEYFNYDKPVPMKAGFTFKNRGRTPARITETSFFFGVIGKITGLPETPYYRTEDAVIEYPRNGLLIVPSELSNVNVDFMDGKEELQPGQLLEIRSGEALLVIYGFVRYRDAFRRKHELRFCYIYHPQKGYNWHGGQFKLGGSSAYNSHT